MLFGTLIRRENMSAFGIAVAVRAIRQQRVIPSWPML